MKPCYSAADERTRHQASTDTNTLTDEKIKINQLWKVVWLKSNKFNTRLLDGKFSDKVPYWVLTKVRIWIMA